MLRWILVLALLAPACKSNDESTRPDQETVQETGTNAKPTPRARPTLSNMDQWSEVMPVEVDGGRSTKTMTVVAGDGTIHAFWLQRDGERQTLWTNQHVDAWTGASRLEEFDENIGSFGVTAGPDGSVWVAWVVHVAGERASWQLWTRRHMAGKWAEPIRVPDSGSASNPAIAVDPNGKVAVTWNTAVEKEVFAATLVGSGTWSNPELVGEGPGPTLVGTADAIHLAWRNEDGVFTRRHDGDAWGAVHKLHDQRPRFAPQFALAGDDLMIAMDSFKTIWWARYSPNGGWTPVEEVGGGKQASVMGHDFVAHPDGRAIVGWSAYKDESMSGNTQIWANAFDGETWGTPQLIQKNPQSTRSPKLGRDANGNTFLAYGQNPPPSDERPSAYAQVLRVTMHSPDRGWAEPVDLGQGSAPWIAARPNGEFLVVFKEIFDTKLSDLKSRAYSME